MLNALMRWLSKAGICAVVGAIAGSITGMFFGLTLVAAPAHAFPLTWAIGIGIALGLLDWILVIIGLALCGYQLLAVLLPAVVTCVTTSIFVTFYLDTLLYTFAGMFGMLIGWFLGLAIGLLLCQICRFVPYGVTVSNYE
jgi:hypothetical protein